MLWGQVASRITTEIEWMKSFCSCWRERKSRKSDYECKLTVYHKLVSHIKFMRPYITRLSIIWRVFFREKEDLWLKSEEADFSNFDMRAKNGLSVMSWTLINFWIFFWDFFIHFCRVKLIKFKKTLSKFIYD